MVGKIINVCKGASTQIRSRRDVCRQSDESCLGAKRCRCYRTTAGLATYEDGQLAEPYGAFGLVPLVPHTSDLLLAPSRRSKRYRRADRAEA